MSTYNDIREALEAKLDAIVGLPQTNSVNNIAWENWGEFVPKANDQWLKVSGVKPVSLKPGSIGFGVPVLHRGLFLVDVFVPEGNGPKDGDTLVDLVLAAFPAGTILTVGSARVNIRFAERIGGFKAEPWYMIPITITWYSFI